QVVLKATGGTFTLTLNGATTGAIAWNAPATGPGSVQAALEALSNVGAGNVAVTESSTFGNPLTVTYTITFQGSLAHTAVSTMTGDKTGLNADVIGTGGGVDGQG